MAIASSPQQAKAASCSLWLADVLKLLAKYSVVPNLGERSINLQVSLFTKPYSITNNVPLTSKLSVQILAL